jgi:hypothetical protein
MGCLADLHAGLPFVTGEVNMDSCITMALLWAGGVHHECASQAGPCKELFLWMIFMTNISWF